MNTPEDIAELKALLSELRKVTDPKGIDLIWSESHGTVVFVPMLPAK